MGCLLCCFNNKNTTNSLKINNPFANQKATALFKDKTIVNNKNNKHNNSSSFSRITFADFELLKVIGKGNFGKVYLARKITNNELYAMKKLKKKRIIDKKQVLHTKTERNLLASLSHPFIVELQYAFQTETSLFMVTNFIQGGELYFHLRKEKYFDEDRTRFIASEIFLALEYLHENKYIYRDLKPENILIDKDGHIKLTDFGLSKVLIEPKSKAKTLCGTPDYLAPEVAMNKGHDFKADWWSFGVLIYELLSGYLPIKIRQGTSYDLNAYDKPITYYNHFTYEAKDLLSKLLVINPQKRLGAKTGEEIKKHSFFKAVNFNDVYLKHVKPPFVPRITNEYDISNFDAKITNEVIQTSLLETPADYFINFTFINPKLNESQGSIDLTK